MKVVDLADINEARQNCHTRLRCLDWDDQGDNVSSWSKFRFVCSSLHCDPSDNLSRM